MSTGKWIAENLSLEGMIRNTGSTVGTVAKLGLQGIGTVVEVAAEAAGAGSHNARTIGNALRTTGEVADIALTKTGEVAGFVANKATEYAGMVEGELAALGAAAAGADQSTIAKRIMEELMDLIDKLVELASRTQRQKDVVLTEQAAKTAFVLPFLQALGYDVFNPAEVIPELTTDHGVKRVKKSITPLSKMTKLLYLSNVKLLAQI